LIAETPRLQSYMPQYAYLNYLYRKKK